MTNLSPGKQDASDLQVKDYNSPSVNDDDDAKEGGQPESVDNYTAVYTSIHPNDSGNICSNYFKQVRIEGDGHVRINENITLREDVYATAFASLLRHQYIEAVEKIYDETINSDEAAKAVQQIQVQVAAQYNNVATYNRANAWREDFKRIRSNR